MKKSSFTEKLKYQFDKYMSKGTVALVGMLFLATAIVVILAGFLASLFSVDDSTGSLIWQSLMHSLDAGTLAGDSIENKGFLILMIFVTICGIFVTSILIGIISTGFEEKLNSLRKGLSRVIESNHTVIIGFNDSIYTILKELIEANLNHKKACIVIIGDQEKEVMDEEIKSHIADFKTTDIICRSGNFTNAHLLEMVSIETSRSIIINKEDDFSVIKGLLAVVSYLKSKKAFENDVHITTLIHDKENLDAAQIAGEGKAEIIFFKDMIARIIAHTCRQPGLSLVLTNFFGYAGAEFYYENFPELDGKRFGEILNLFENSTIVGIFRDKTTMLNPPMDTIMKATDCVIHLAEDDGVSKPQTTVPTFDILTVINSLKKESSVPFHLLVLGHNDNLHSILEELDQFVTKGSNVVIAADSVLDEWKDELQFTNLEIQIIEDNIYKKSTLENLLTDDIHNILLLSNDSLDKEDADSKTMLLLLQLRDIASKRQKEFDIISEMHSVENQKLAQVTRVNDFVVGSSITHLIITQISENRSLSSLFQDILDADGSELYMKLATTYVKPNAEVNFYMLTEIAKARNEIVIGYKKKEKGEMVIVTNPSKSSVVSFDEDDYLIVFAQD